jgi:hypothetical protein
LNGQGVVLLGLGRDEGSQGRIGSKDIVLPGQHVLGLMGFQQAVTAEVAEDPFSDGVLEVLHEFGAEGSGLVEVEARCRIGRVLIRILLDPLEEAVDHAQVVMEMRIETGAEAMEETDGPEGSGLWSRGAGFFEGSRQGPEQNAEHGACGPRPVMEEGPKTFGDG